MSKQSLENEEEIISDVKEYFFEVVSDDKTKELVSRIGMKNNFVFMSTDEISLTTDFLKELVEHFCNLTFLVFMPKTPETPSFDISEEKKNVFLIRTGLPKHEIVYFMLLFRKKLEKLAKKEGVEKKYAFITNKSIDEERRSLITINNKPYAFAKVKGDCLRCPLTENKITEEMEEEARMQTEGCPKN